MPPPLDHILLDKDNTLGLFGIQQPGLFPYVQQFLEHQYNQHRKLSIATTAQRSKTITDLKEISHLIDNYFCREQFRIQDSAGITIKSFFIDEQGTITEQQKDQPQPTGIEYTNPYDPKFIFKDLHLIKRYLSPTKYHTLRTIMIGDDDDGNFAPASDPYTPVIVINNQQRSGYWDPLSIIIDLLFENKKNLPCEQFNELYTLGQKNKRKNINHDILETEISTIRLYNQTYELDRIDNGKRIIITE